MSSSVPATKQEPPTQVGGVPHQHTRLASGAPVLNRRESAPNTEHRTPNEYRDTRVRGDAALAFGERAWTHVERVLGLGLPQVWNPMAYTGALAGYTFIVAAVTGVLLLFWYDASVHSAYASVEAMQRQPWGGGFVRALHRYSSDACVLFAVIHAVKVFLTRRFTGARWVAWVTGILILLLIWLDGWLGYWLVWDERAKAVAVGTAHVLDALPIFPEPVAGSFLTNDSINSLMFFAVFFAHMLLPIPIGVLIWIHLARLKKPRFLPSRKLAWITLAVLTLVSLIVPASLAAPADMAALGAEFDIDWFYLLPLLLTDRLDPAVVWVIFIGSLLLLCALPFVMGKRRRKPALVNQDICNGCTQCMQDCPYEAITMVPKDGKIELVALVDPARCVSCGVCVGACDPGSMTFEELERRDVRERITRWLDNENGPRDIAFLCADGAGAKVRFNTQSGLADDLPGWRVIGVPCAAWVHSSLVEMIARKGGRALIVACEGPEPRCRMGSEIAEQRALNQRHPEFKPERIPEGTFHFVMLPADNLPSLQLAAHEFSEGASSPAGNGRAPSRWKLLATGALAALVLTALTVGFSRFVYVAPPAPDSMLVVSFKHAGAEVEEGAEVETGLDHLKGMKRRTRRLPVRLRVTVDGEVLHEQAHEPRGVRGDSASMATLEFAMKPGTREVVMEIGESAEGWTQVERGAVVFKEGRRRVLRFDQGFRWDTD